MVVCLDEMGHRERMRLRAVFEFFWSILELEVLQVPGRCLLQRDRVDVDGRAPTVWLVAERYLVGRPKQQFLTMRLPPRVPRD